MPKKKNNAVALLLALAALWMASNTLHGGARLTRDGKVIRLANEQVATTFNLASGEWEAMTPDGVVFASDLRCSWGDDTNHSTSMGPPTYSFIRSRPNSDQGIRVEIARGRLTPFLLLLTVPDTQPWIVARIRAPLRDVDTNAIPVSFSGSLHPNAIWSGKRLVTLSQNPDWRGGAQLFGALATGQAVANASTGLVFIGESGTLRGNYLGALTDMAIVRLSTRLEPQTIARGMQFTASWRQPVAPCDKDPTQWESVPWLISAPEEAPRLSGRLRRASQTENPAAASRPTDLRILDAFDRFMQPGTNAPGPGPSRE